MPTHWTSKRQEGHDDTADHVRSADTSATDTNPTDTSADPTPTRRRRLIARPVIEIMSRPVYSVTGDLTLGDVLTVMVRSGLRHLGVVDELDRCLGIVGDRAVAAAWATDPAALSYLPVHRVLDRRPSVVGLDATVGEAAQTMYADQVDAVAVIDRSGHPVGMITGGDLIALLAAQVEEVVEEVVEQAVEKAVEKAVEMAVEKTAEEPAEEGGPAARPSAGPGAGPPAGPSGGPARSGP